MCPDKKMITSFIDNELENEYRLILEKHFEICSSCSGKIEKFANLKKELKFIEYDLDFIDSEKKVWYRINNKILNAADKSRNTFKMVPFPMFAAAALLLMFFAGAFFIKSGEKTVKTIPAQTVEIGETMLEEVKNYLYDSSGEIAENTSIHISDKELQQLIDLLSSNSAEMEVTISLPNEPAFDIFGKPEMVRSDEYRRYQQ